MGNKVSGRSALPAKLPDASSVFFYHKIFTEVNCTSVTGKAKFFSPRRGLVNLRLHLTPPGFQPLFPPETGLAGFPQGHFIKMRIV